MKFEIVNPSDIILKEGDVKRSVSVRQMVAFKPLPEHWEGEVAWTCARTDETTRFIQTDGVYYEDTKLKLVQNGKLPKSLFYEEERFFWRKDRSYSEEDIIDWSSQVRRKAAGLRLQDINIWRRSPGPVLKIASKQYGWHTALVSGHPELRNDHLFSFHFGVDEIDEARAWLETLLREGRKGFFGTLTIKNVDGPFIPGAYLDAINAANTVRADFEYVYEVEYLSRKTLELFRTLRLWLGEWNHRSEWPPEYRTFDLTEYQESDCVRLLKTAAEIVGNVRAAGKNNFPQQSKNFDRHMRKADKWISSIWGQHDALATLLNPAPPPAHNLYDDDEDDDGLSIY
jgi:hypothetical protein